MKSAVRFSDAPNIINQHSNTSADSSHILTLSTQSQSDEVSISSEQSNVHGSVFKDRKTHAGVTPHNKKTEAIQSQQLLASLLAMDTSAMLPPTPVQSTPAAAGVSIKYVPIEVNHNGGVNYSKLQSILGLSDSPATGYSPNQTPRSTHSNRSHNSSNCSIVSPFASNEASPEEVRTTTAAAAMDNHRMNSTDTAIIVDPNEGLSSISTVSASPDSMDSNTRVEISPAADSIREASKADVKPQRPSPPSATVAAATANNTVATAYTTTAIATAATYSPRAAAGVRFKETVKFVDEDGNSIASDGENQHPNAPNNRQLTTAATTATTRARVATPAAVAGRKSLTRKATPGASPRSLKATAAAAAEMNDTSVSDAMSLDSIDANLDATFAAASTNKKLVLATTVVDANTAAASNRSNNGSSRGEVVPHQLGTPQSNRKHPLLTTNAVAADTDTAVASAFIATVEEATSAAASSRQFGFFTKQKMYSGDRQYLPSTPPSMGTTTTAATALPTELSSDTSCHSSTNNSNRQSNSNNNSSSDVCCDLSADLSSPALLCRRGGVSLQRGPLIGKSSSTRVPLSLPLTSSSHSSSSTSSSNNDSSSNVGRVTAPSHSSNSRSSTTTTASGIASFGQQQQQLNPAVHFTAADKLSSPALHHLEATRVERKKPPFNLPKSKKSSKKKQQQLKSDAHMLDTSAIQNIGSMDDSYAGDSKSSVVAAIATAAVPTAAAEMSMLSAITEPQHEHDVSTSTEPTVASTNTQHRSMQQKLHHHQQQQQRKNDVSCSTSVASSASNNKKQQQQKQQQHQKHVQCVRNVSIQCSGASLLLSDDESSLLPHRPTAPVPDLSDDSYGTYRGDGNTAATAAMMNISTMPLAPADVTFAATDAATAASAFTDEDEEAFDSFDAQSFDPMDFKSSPSSADNDDEDEEEGLFAALHDDDDDSRHGIAAYANITHPAPVNTPPLPPHKHTPVFTSYRKEKKLTSATSATAASAARGKATAARKATTANATALTTTAKAGVNAGVVVNPEEEEESEDDELEMGLCDLLMSSLPPQIVSVPPKRTVFTTTTAALGVDANFLCNAKASPQQRQQSQQQQQLQQQQYLQQQRWQQQQQQERQRHSSNMGSAQRVKKTTTFLVDECETSSSPSSTGSSNNSSNNNRSNSQLAAAAFDCTVVTDMAVNDANQSMFFDNNNIDFEADADDFCYNNNSNEEEEKGMLMMGAALQDTSTSFSTAAVTLAETTITLDINHCQQLLDNSFNSSTAANGATGSGSNGARLAVMPLKREKDAVQDIKEVMFDSQEGEVTTVSLCFCNRRKKLLRMHANAITMRFESRGNSSIAATAATTTTAANGYYSIEHTDDDGDSIARCFQVTPAVLELAPGEDGQLLITFAPKRGLVGVCSGALKIRSRRKSFVILLRGEAKPKRLPQQQLQQQLSRVSEADESQTMPESTAMNSSASQEWEQKFSVLHQRISEMSKKVADSASKREQQQRNDFSGNSRSYSSSNMSAVSASPEPVNNFTTATTAAASTTTTATTAGSVVVGTAATASKSNICSSNNRGYNVTSSSSITAVTSSAMADVVPFKLPSSVLVQKRTYSGAYEATLPLHCTSSTAASATSSTAAAVASYSNGTISLVPSEPFIRLSKSSIHLSGSAGEETIEVSVDDQSKALATVCRQVLGQHSQQSGFFTATVGFVQVYYQPPPPQQQQQQQQQLKQQQSEQMVLLQAVAVNMTKSACFMLDKYQLDGLPTPVSQRKPTALTTTTTVATSIYRSTADRHVVDQSTYSTSSTSPAGMGTTVTPFSHPQQQQKKQQLQQQHSRLYEHSNVSATAAADHSNISHCKQWTANVSYHQLPPSTAAATESDSYSSSSALFPQLMSQQQQQQQLIECKRGVFFRRDSINFGAVAIGSLTRTKIELCNSTDDEMMVYLGDPALPFVLLHNEVRLRARSYVRIPVRFLPIHGGSSSTELIAQTEDGSFHTKIALTGSAYA